MRLKYLDNLDSLRLRRRPVYEPAEVGLVTARLRPGDTFIDIGAHIGYYTLLASGIVGRLGMVIAFEPEPSNFYLLQKNVEAAGATNVLMVPKAVSAWTATATLYINPRNTGDNRLTGPPPGDQLKRLEVDTTTLDAFLTDYRQPIRFIKVDVQGHELSVFRGAVGTIDRFLDLAMLVEFFPEGIVQNGDTPAALLKEISDLGFKITWPPLAVINACTPTNGKHCNLYLEKS